VILAPGPGLGGRLLGLRGALRLNCSPAPVTIAKYVVLVMQEIISLFFLLYFVKIMSYIIERQVRSADGGLVVLIRMKGLDPE
jgi:hypothetical protein